MSIQLKIAQVVALFLALGMQDAAADCGIRPDKPNKICVWQPSNSKSVCSKDVDPDELEQTSKNFCLQIRKNPAYVEAMESLKRDFDASTYYKFDCRVIPSRDPGYPGNPKGNYNGQERLVIAAHKISTLTNNLVNGGYFLVSGLKTTPDQPYVKGYEVPIVANDFCKIVNGEPFADGAAGDVKREWAATLKWPARPPDLRFSQVQHMSQVLLDEVRPATVPEIHNYLLEGASTFGGPMRNAPALQ